MEALGQGVLRRKGKFLLAFVGFDWLALTLDRRAHRLNPVTPQVGDLVLLNTEHYNLMLPSQKLAPKW
eukprot:2296443-Rhodomonas_salina.1